MTDNNLDQSSSNGTTGTPNPSNSDGKNGDNSVDAKKLQSTIDNLTKRLDEIDTRARTVQGEKDKTLSKTTKEVEELKRQIAEIDKLKKTGLDPDAAIEEFTFREEVKGLREQLMRLNPASVQPAGNGVSGVESEAQRLAKELQLDMNDKDIADAVGKGVSELFKVVVAKQSNPPSVSDAPPPVGNPPASKTVAALTEDYKKEVRAARGNRTAISALREKYKGQGVDVYSIDFS